MFLKFQLGLTTHCLCLDYCLLPITQWLGFTEEFLSEVAVSCFLLVQLPRMNYIQFPRFRFSLSVRSLFLPFSPTFPGVCVIPFPPPPPYSLSYLSPLLLGSSTPIAVCRVSSSGPTTTLRASTRLVCGRCQCVAVTRLVCGRCQGLVCCRCQVSVWQM